MNEELKKEVVRLEQAIYASRSRGELFRNVAKISDLLDRATLAERQRCYDIAMRVAHNTSEEATDASLEIATAIKFLQEGND